MTGIQLLILLITHYIADFWVQTHEQSQKKSSSIKYLTNHIITYSMCFVLPATYMFHDIRVLYVFLLTFITHWITDYFTSRWAKYYFEQSKIRQGFQVVGFDQLIHMITIYLTFKLMTWMGGI